MSTATGQATDAALPSLDQPEAQQRLARWLAGAAGAGKLSITAMTRLSGGAIQENWALSAQADGGDPHGLQEWVLRTDAASAVALSLSRAQEFAILQVAHAAGVAVPEPLWLCRDRSVIGREFFLMRRIAGVAAGHRLVRDDELVPDRAALGEALGENLARLHAVAPPNADLDFLPPPPANHALAAIAEYRRHLDQLGAAHPVLEWGLRWCERRAPAGGSVSLIHRDFRTGNYMVERGRLTGVLDWEFAAWGDPMEDLGWLTAKCWRFGAVQREAGGVASLEDLLRGYRRVSGHAVDAQALRYWQVMAHLRWAVIALQQADRHLSGRQRSLELALTGRLVPELEMEILHLTTEAGDE